MYDLKELKAIPCGDVASKHGIKLNKKHNRLWGKFRNEKTASFSINLENNLWYDFGAGKGGSVIDLVAELNGVTPNEAIKILAQDYGIESDVKDPNKWRPLTDNQYRILGIEPERATMNFEFDLNKHSIDQLSRWSSKYGMHIRDLADKFPDVYNKLISKFALKNINLLRSSYFSSLKLSLDNTVDALSRTLYKRLADENEKLINERVNLLNRALKDVNKKFDHLKVSMDQDYKSISNVRQKEKERILNDGEKIRNKLIKVYKNLFDVSLGNSFSVSHAIALHELNIAISKSDNSFLSVVAIKELYGKLGKVIDEMSADYNEHLMIGKNLERDTEAYKKWQKEADDVSKYITQQKELFAKVSKIMDGFRENSKSNVIAKEKCQDKNRDLHELTK